MIVAIEDIKKKISAFSNDSIYGVVETVGSSTFMFMLLSLADVALLLFIIGKIYKKNNTARASNTMVPTTILNIESELSTGDVGVFIIVVIFLLDEVFNYITHHTYSRNERIYITNRKTQSPLRMQFRLSYIVRPKITSRETGKHQQ